MPRRPSITRDQALSARPLATGIVSREPFGDGQVRIEVPYQPRGIQRWLLRLPVNATRKYELDAFGVQVLDMCDGKTSVKRIIRKFVKEHQLNPHEAEQAVVTFLRSLMRNGVVSMVVDRQ